jgi:flagellar basal-body rod modification protein FlgD
MIDKALLGSSPEAKRSPAYDAAIKQKPAQSDVNFDNLMMQSAADVAAERQKEKAMTTPGGNEIRLGESKDDAKFREQLEKISGKKQEPIKNKLGKDDFLNLMVTQLKYQDPTKPMETNEMATQLAQFNSVEQLVHMNKTMGDLVKAQTESRSDRLTQYLGMNVQVASNSFKLGEKGMANEAFFDLPISAGQCSVAIKDAAGTVVRNIAMGTAEIGNHKVEWDGLDDKGQKASSGQYTFEVNASTSDGKPINTRQSITARVEAITSLHEGGKLDTTAGTLEPAKIIAVRGANQTITTSANTPSATPIPPAASTATAASAPTPTAPITAQQATTNAPALASPSATVKPPVVNKTETAPRHPSAAEPTKVSKSVKPTTEQKEAKVS